MARSISQWLHQVSNGRLTLFALVVFLLFTAVVLPRQAAGSGSETAEAGTPDTSLYYSREALYQMAEAYGESGRRAYIRARFTFDVIWPVIYTAFLVTAISWLTSRGFPRQSGWQLANLVPLAAVLYDFLENASTSLVMWRYPAATPVADAAAGLFTLVKWLLVGGSFLLLLTAVGAALWRRVSSTSTNGE